MNSAEIEKQVIEAILKDNTIFYTLGLEKRDFTDRFCTTVFETINSMLNKGMEVNIGSLSSENTDLSISQIASLNPITAANAEYYAHELKEQTRRRETNTLLRELLERNKTDKDIQGVIDYATAELLRILEHRDTNLKKAKDRILNTIQKIEDIHRNGGETSGIHTGYKDFDDLTGGFHGGELIIIAARTSIGKTALALNMAERMSLAGKGVAFFSAEMSEEQIMMRLVSSIGHIRHQRIRHGQLMHSDFVSLTDAGEKIYGMNLWIDDTPNIHFSHLRNRCRVLKTRGVEVIIIDYLTLIQYGSYKTPRYERVGELVREMKSLARELNIPVIVLSQLNRQAEGQNPTLAELRQSGEIEEHSDMIILMNRERGEKLTTLKIAKHRNGPTGEINLHFIEEETRFEAALHE